MDHQIHETLGIKNLDCFLVMRSLLSRKYVTEVFSWQWHYYFLKPEGVKYLREYFGLPASVVPNTHKTDRTVKEDEEERKKIEISLPSFLYYILAFLHPSLSKEIFFECFRCCVFLYICFFLH